MGSAFQRLIEQRSIALAKSLGHASVECSHVRHVLAESLPDLENEQDLRTALRHELPPTGRYFRMPTIAEEASAYLSKCTTAEAALRLLLNETQQSREEPEVIIAPRAADRVTSPKAQATNTNESVAGILAELDSLIGLRSVKEQVRKVVSVVQANRVREGAGLRPVPQSLHLVFTGNPGTGKTTVARLVARLYSAIGAIRGTGFVEATRSELIAGYVGQTAKKTTSVLTSARPGVVFIDEAYSLRPSHPGDFAEECIASLVKGMEDHRQDLAVIVAGYTREMGEFVNSNPGLRSRFQTFIEFPDYTSEELLQIVERYTLEANVRLAPDAREAIRSNLEVAAGRVDFGNARYARALWEEAFANMALRAHEDGETLVSELEEIAIRDVPKPLQGVIAGQKRKLGFFD